MIVRRFVLVAAAAAVVALAGACTADSGPEGDAGASGQTPPTSDAGRVAESGPDAGSMNTGSDVAASDAVQDGGEDTEQDSDAVADPVQGDDDMVFNTLYGGRWMPNVNKGLIEATDPAQVALGQGTPQFVDFFGYWCTICNAQAPAISATKSDFEGAVEYLHLDVDDPANADLLSQFQVTRTPTYVLLDGDGTVVQQWVGRTDTDEIASELARLVEGAS